MLSGDAEHEPESCEVTLQVTRPSGPLSTGGPFFCQRIGVGPRQPGCENPAPHPQRARVHRASSSPGGYQPTLSRPPVWLDRLWKPHHTVGMASVASAATASAPSRWSMTEYVCAACLWSRKVRDTQPPPKCLRCGTGPMLADDPGIPCLISVACRACHPPSGKPIIESKPEAPGDRGSDIPLSQVRHGHCGGSSLRAVLNWGCTLSPSKFLIVTGPVRE